MDIMAFSLVALVVVVAIAAVGTFKRHRALKSVIACSRVAE